MRDLDLEYTFRLEQDYWWFRGMREVARNWIGGLQPSRVLDAGCGTGYHMGWMASLWPSAGVYGIDVASTALRFARTRGSHPMAQASIAALPFQAASFDLITSFDVLSQVPLDLSTVAISEFLRILAPGGWIFLRVPATPWLRSSHDEELQTYTRFSRAQLQSFLTAAGLTVERISYVNTLLFPVAAARRLLKRAGLGSGSDVRPLPRAWSFMESPFFAALRAEAAWLGRPGRSLPFGLSLHALARRP